MGYDVIAFATKKNEEYFQKECLLAKSPCVISKDFVLEPAYENSRGLPAVYNEILRRHRGKDVNSILFVHDDVRIDDGLVKSKLYEGFKDFDIIGLAGCSKFIISTAAWGSRANSGFSGAVAHMHHGRIGMTVFGVSPDKCAVIDGLFIAVNRKLINSGIEFDEDFDFHLYDLSFCVRAIRAGMKIGTYPIWVVHNSIGDFQSEGWKVSAKRFVLKYGGN